MYLDDSVFDEQCHLTGIDKISRAACVEDARSKRKLIYNETQIRLQIRTHPPGGPEEDTIAGCSS